MRNKHLHQEFLKIIACVTMVLDHIGAFLVPQIWLRCVGRLAFPIYCFLLVEGFHHTKNPKGYALRLLIGAILSELPYDLLLSGGISFARQSVMITLLLGFLMLQLMKKLPQSWQKILLILPFYGIAELLQCDYGGAGILTIAIFALVPTVPVQALLLAVLFGSMNGYTLFFLGIPFSIQLLGVISLVPIALYSGKKITDQKWIQWGFYLFYPVHLVLLYFIQEVIL